MKTNRAADLHLEHPLVITAEAIRASREAGDSFQARRDAAAAYMVNQALARPHYTTTAEEHEAMSTATDEELKEYRLLRRWRSEAYYVVCRIGDGVKGPFSVDRVAVSGLVAAGYIDYDPRSGQARLTRKGQALAAEEELRRQAAADETVTGPVSYYKVFRAEKPINFGAISSKSTKP